MSEIEDGNQWTDLPWEGQPTKRRSRDIVQELIDLPSATSVAGAALLSETRYPRLAAVSAAPPILVGSKSSVSLAMSHAQGCECPHCRYLASHSDDFEDDQRNSIWT
jgi:hypothetical protein